MQQIETLLILCSCMTLIEIWEWVSFLVMLAFLRTHVQSNNFEFVRVKGINMWLLGTLLVANIMRAIVASCARPLARSLNVHFSQWRQQVSLCVVIISAAVQCEVLFAIYIAAHWFSDDPSCPVDLALCTDEQSKILWDFWATMSFVFSSASCYSIMFNLARPCPEPPPKPRIQSFVVQDVSSECGDSGCAICLDEFSFGCLAARLPCNHVFHDCCVRSWLSQGRPQTWCPMRCSSVAAASLNQEPVTIGNARTSELHSPQRTSLTSTSISI